MYYNFYASNHKINQDNRFSERVECEGLEEVKEYAERMKDVWKCENVYVYECDTNEPVVIND